MPPSLPKQMPNMMPNFLHQQQQAFINNQTAVSTAGGLNTQLNNSLLLRSMSYLNPMIMMNLLSSRVHLQNNNTTNPPSLQWVQHQALMNLANNRSIIQQQQQQQQQQLHHLQQKDQQTKFHLISEQMVASSVSSSSSSDDQLNDSISNDYHDEIEDGEVNNRDEEEAELGEVKEENSIYAESYENSNVSESMIKETNKHNNDEYIDEHDLGSFDSASNSMNKPSQMTNDELKNKSNGKKKRFESNSTGEFSSGTSSLSNYTDHSNSLINLHSSPASSSSASSSSNNTPSNTNNNSENNSRLATYFNSQKTHIEKKINFAIISTLVD